MKILGIETSCDETSATIVEGEPSHTPYRLSHIAIFSNIISSQIDLHKKYGGVVPEVASRAHIESIIPVIEESLKKAKNKLENIDAIVVTVGPGLIGSLLVGVNTAKTLAIVLNKPLIAVNHLEGHIYANFVREIPSNKFQISNKAQNSKFQIPNSAMPQFPIVALLASGGHTMLVYMGSHLKYKILGQTKDDAAGETFDKVAKILDIGYPGGPIIEKLAQGGNTKAFNFPQAEMEGKTIRTKEGFLKKIPPNLDFSFSGIKTAVLYKHKILNTKYKIQDFAASFQEAVIDVLVKKTIWAAERTKAKSILLSGGVAANDFLRNRLETESEKFGYKFFAPPKILCTDNAAMIATAGYFRYISGKYSNSKKIKINPNLKLK